MPWLINSMVKQHCCLENWQAGKLAHKELETANINVSNDSALEVMESILTKQPPCSLAKIIITSLANRLVSFQTKPNISFMG